MRAEPAEAQHDGEDQRQTQVGKGSGSNRRQEALAWIAHALRRYRGAAEYAEADDREHQPAHPIDMHQRV